MAGKLLAIRVVQGDCEGVYPRMYIRVVTSGGGHFENTNELVNVGTHKYQLVNKLYIIQCMDKIFCVEFGSEPLKLYTKYLTHTL